MTYANGLTEDYVYDALDNLIEIGYTVNGGQRQVAFTYSYAADGIDTKYYYDGDRLLAEIGGTTGDFVFMYDGTGYSLT